MTFHGKPRRRRRHGRRRMTPRACACTATATPTTSPTEPADECSNVLVPLYILRGRRGVGGRRLPAISSSAHAEHIEHFFAGLAGRAADEHIAARPSTACRSGSSWSATIAMILGFGAGLVQCTSVAKTCPGAWPRSNRGLYTVPAQQVVLRRALRLHLRHARALAPRPRAVEGLRRLADRPDHRPRASATRRRTSPAAW